MHTNSWNVKRQCPGLAPKRLPLPAATLVSLILIPCLTCLEPKGLISNYYIILFLFHYVIFFYNYHSIIIFVVHVILLLYMISMFSYHCVIRLIQHQCLIFVYVLYSYNLILQIIILLYSSIFLLLYSCFVVSVLDRLCDCL